jgi:hypothetical protein
VKQKIAIKDEKNFEKQINGKFIHKGSAYENK